MHTAKGNQRLGRKVIGKRSGPYPEATDISRRPQTTALLARSVSFLTRISYLYQFIFQHSNILTASCARVFLVFSSRERLSELFTLLPSCVLMLSTVICRSVECRCQYRITTGNISDHGIDHGDGPRGTCTVRVKSVLPSPAVSAA